MKAIVNTIIESFGPLGNDTLIKTSSTQLVITKCSSTIINCLKITNIYGNIILNTIKKYRDIYGDGTSILTIGISELFDELSIFIYHLSFNYNRLYIDISNIIDYLHYNILNKDIISLIIKKSYFV